MKEPFWKRWLSYLWDIQIDYRSSEYNPDLVVLLSQGRYQLCTDTAVYSYEDKYYNFRKVLEENIDYSSLIGKRVLILGLGLGSIPQILDGVKPGAWEFTAVEIDEQVCELAAIYGYPKILSSIDTVIADAYSYIGSCQESFDIVCVDVFIGADTPQKFRSSRFLDRLPRLLKDGGYIVYNTPAFTEEDKVISESFYEEVFSVSLADSKKIYAHRNYMLLWQKESK